MGLLDRISEQQTLDDNQNVADAQHDLDWKSTFASTPPADVIRSRVNYADAINRAFDNKIALQARSDVQALDLLHKTAKHREWMDQAPLREELLKRKVASEGAHDEFLQRKDSEAMADLTGFLKSAGSMTSKEGTPEYQQELNGLIAKYPRIIGTQVGADTLKRIQQSHSDISLVTPPEGKKVGDITMGSDGKWRAKFVDITPEGTEGFRGTAEEARDKYGPSAKLHETAKGVWTVTLPPEDFASRAADRTRAVLGVRQEFKPAQQEVIDNLVAKQRALNGLKPTDQEKIDFAVAKKSALKDLDPTDADKIAFHVAQQTALDAIKPTDDQRIAFAVARKSALKDLDPTEDERIAFKVAQRSALDAIKPTEEQRIAFHVAQQKALNDLKPTDQEKIDFEVAKKAATQSSSTFKQFNKELAEMVKSYGGPDKVPAARWAEFERRKAAIGKAVTEPVKEKTSVKESPSGVTITTKEDFDALPSGAEFTWNGRRGKKP